MAHHPPHIYRDDPWYMVTAATLYNRPYLSAQRVLLQNELRCKLAFAPRGRVHRSEGLCNWTHLIIDNNPSDVSDEE
jgi:hypothetical protein